MNPRTPKTEDDYTGACPTGYGSRMTPILLTALTLPGPTAEWDTLSKSPSHVECTQAEPVFCRSTAVFQASQEKLTDTLAHMTEHKDNFESIATLTELEPNLLHVVMDFPNPLADRDYVARYSQSKGDNGSTVISWQSVEHPGAPETEDRVRLSDFAGSWTLAGQADGTTVVTYLWHGSYGGALPSWALNTARKKTGSEALKDLAHAAGSVSWTAPKP